MRGRHRTLAALAYLAMIAAAVVVAWLRGVSLLEIEGLEGSSRLSALVLGAGLGAVAAMATRVTTLRSRWVRDMRRELRALLDGVPVRDALGLALASGIAEELFFRGALQPWLGFWPTALVFGAVHVGPRSLRVWPLWAFVMGLVLGELYAATGHIEGPIALHVVVNWLNLRFVLNTDPRLDRDLGAHKPQSLVARRVRRD